MEGNEFNIVIAILSGILAALYVVVTCLYAIQGALVCVILYAICSVIWGGCFGVWLHKAVSYKDVEFYKQGYFEKFNECIELKRQKIELLREVKIENDYATEFFKKLIDALVK